MNRSHRSTERIVFSFPGLHRDSLIGICSGRKKGEARWVLRGEERSLNKDLEASRSWGHCLDSLAEAERKQGCLVRGAGLERLSGGALSGAWGNPEPFQ